MRFVENSTLPPSEFSPAKSGGFGFADGMSLKVKRKSDLSWASSRPREFAESLAQLLDTTGIDSRKGWAAYLGVTESAVSQWTTDETLIRPEHLRRVWERVRTNENVPSRIVEKFINMACKPANAVSRHAPRIGSSVAEYMARPRFEKLWQGVRELPLLGLEHVLGQAERLLDAQVESNSAFIPAGNEMKQSSRRGSESAWLHCMAARLNPEKPDEGSQMAELVVEAAKEEFRDKIRLRLITSDVLSRVRRQDESIVSRLSELPGAILIFFLADPTYAVEAESESGWSRITPTTALGEGQAGQLAFERNIRIRVDLNQKPSAEIARKTLPSI